jgi:hypothetical protein
MEHGQIVQWTFVNEFNNHGVIIGCFGNVHGQPFSFGIGDVSPAIAAFLRTHPHIGVAPNCTPSASALWVTFLPVGPNATNITN